MRLMIFQFSSFSGSKLAVVAPAANAACTMRASGASAIDTFAKRCPSGFRGAFSPDVSSLRHEWIMFTNGSPMFVTPAAHPVAFVRMFGTSAFFTVVGVPFSPCGERMLFPVFLGRKNLKIVNSVVPFNPILVVDVLRARKFNTKTTFNDSAMFKNLFGGALESKVNISGAGVNDSPVRKSEDDPMLSGRRLINNERKVCALEAAISRRRRIYIRAASLAGFKPSSLLSSVLAPALMAAKVPGMVVGSHLKRCLAEITMVGCYFSHVVNASCIASESQGAIWR